VALRRPQELRAAAGPAEELERLHRDDDEREPPVAEVEGARVGLGGLDGERARTVAQGGEQVAVAVERDDLEAAPREVERDPPGAGADVQHRPAVLLGELAPQRQVGVVGAALDVVPDRGAHPSALPPSTRRSSSIAVYVGSA
jgi:hypothetical protein